MKASQLWAFLVIALPLIAFGCAQNDTPPPDKEAKIKASLDQLDPADRKLAEEQKYCAVETENRLGSMSKPIKVMIKDQPVFLCCKGCIEKGTERSGQNSRHRQETQVQPAPRGEREKPRNTRKTRIKGTNKVASAGSQPAG